MSGNARDALAELVRDKAPDLSFLEPFGLRPREQDAFVILARVAVKQDTFPHFMGATKAIKEKGLSGPYVTFVGNKGVMEVSNELPRGGWVFTPKLLEALNGKGPSSEKKEGRGHKGGVTKKRGKKRGRRTKARTATAPGAGDNAVLEFLRSSSKGGVVIVNKALLASTAEALSRKSKGIVNEIARLVKAGVLVKAKVRNVGKAKAYAFASSTATTQPPPSRKSSILSGITLDTPVGAIRDRILERNQKLDEEAAGLNARLAEIDSAKERNINMLRELGIE